MKLPWSNQRLETGMSNPGFGLMVSPVGTLDAVDPATGEHKGLYQDGETGTATAFLPHSCDEWVIGQGSPIEVIAGLRQMRSEIDVAIAYLEAA